MNFAEKIMGIFRNESEADNAEELPTQPDAEQPDAQVLPDDVPATLETRTSDLDAPQSYSLEEVEKIVEQRRTEWEHARSRDEAETPLTPSVTETPEQEIARLKQELACRDRKTAIVDKLTQEDFPVGLAALINYSSDESCQESYDILTKAFRDELAIAIQNRFKGKTPMGLGIQKAPRTYNETGGSFEKALHKPTTSLILTGGYGNGN